MGADHGIERWPSATAPLSPTDRTNTPSSTPQRRPTASGTSTKRVSTCSMAASWTASSGSYSATVSTTKAYRWLRHADGTRLGPTSRRCFGCSTLWRPPTGPNSTTRNSATRRAVQPVLQPACRVDGPGGKRGPPRSRLPHRPKVLVTERIGYRFWVPAVSPVEPPSSSSSGLRVATGWPECHRKVTRPGSSRVY